MKIKGVWRPLAVWTRRRRIKHPMPNNVAYNVKYYAQSYCARSWFTGFFHRLRVRDPIIHLNKSYPPDASPSSRAFRSIGASDYRPSVLPTPIPTIAPTTQWPRGLWNQSERLSLHTEIIVMFTATPTAVYPPPQPLGGDNDFRRTVRTINKRWSFTDSTIK